MRFIYSFFLLTLLILGSTTAAASVGISIYQVVLDANSSKRNEQVTISNTSQEKKNYRIKLVNYKQLPDGSFKEIETPVKDAPFASPYLVISPNKTTLESGRTQTIRIQRKPMINAPDGEYVSRLLIQEIEENSKLLEKNTDNTFKIQAKAIYAVTIPVIIQKGKLSASGEIVNPKVITKNSQKVVAAEIKRQGTKSLFVNIIVKNAKGDEIGAIRRLRVYLTTNTRKIDVPLEKYNDKDKLTVELIDVESGEKISAKDIPW